MAIPGLGNVFGVAAVILYDRLDPRGKEDRLLDAKKAILNGPETIDKALHLQRIDDELARVRRAINRKAG